MRERKNRTDMDVERSWRRETKDTKGQREGIVCVQPMLVRMIHHSIDLTYAILTCK